MFKKFGFRPYGKVLSCNPYPVAGSENVRKGDPVYRTSGRISVAASTTVPIFGVAAIPLSGTTGTTADTDIWVWDSSEQKYIGSFGDNAISGAHIAGKLVDLSGSGGNFVIDSDGDTYHQIELIDYAKGAFENNDDFAAEVIFKFTTHEGNQVNSAYPITFASMSCSGSGNAAIMYASGSATWYITGSFFQRGYLKTIISGSTYYVPYGTFA